MNCQAVQKDLLGSERPGRPSVAASAHLAACAACREWQQRLAQMEDAVALLPVPPASAARSALVRRVLSGEGLKRRKSGARPGLNGQPARRPSIAMVVGSWIMDPHASPRRRVAAGLVAGVAASLLLFITGWLVWDASHNAPSVAGVSTAKAAPADPVLAGLDKYKIKLRAGTSTRDGIEAMAEAADQLREHADARHEDDALIELARLYGDVVDDRLVKLAEKLSDEGVSGEDRRQLLEPIAARLDKGYSQWHQLSQQTGLADGTKAALAKAASAARRVNMRLLELCKA